MLKKDKNNLIDTLSEIYLANQVIVFTRFSHLSISKIDELRRSLRSCDAFLKIVKNRLSRIAFEKNKVNLNQEFFVGPVAVVCSNQPIETIKVLFDFSKKHSKFSVFSAVLDHQLVAYEDLVQLSRIPSLNAIRYRVVNALSAPAKKIVINLNSSAVRIMSLLTNLSNKN